MLRASNFFAINATPTSNLLDNNHRTYSNFLQMSNFFRQRWMSPKLHTVKRVDEVVRHPHLVTQDQFTQVSKKVSDIPEENFTINIKFFQQNFTFVELLRYNHIPHVEIVEDGHRTSPTDCSFKNVELLRHSAKSQKEHHPGREPTLSDLHSDTLPLRHTFLHS